MRSKRIAVAVCICLCPSTSFLSRSAGEEPLRQPAFTYAEITGIGKEKGVCRRDPSDLVRVGDTYYVWYSRVTRQEAKPGRDGYPSGYQATVWYATSTDEGRTWIEKGEAIDKGTGSAFDAHGCFTPNILVWRGRYYLYYTAVAQGFDNGEYSDVNRTAIGLAEAESPDGPWTKVSDTPVFESTRDPAKFDSYRVDDACFIVREGKIWMYYKGRQWQRTPGETKMGVAVSEKPGGPFTRLNGGNPVQDSGHEVLVWPAGTGVMSLVSRTGPHGMTLQYAEDGTAFRVAGTLPRNYPKAPGLFRADLTAPAAHGKGVRWGICMATYGGDPYLRRFEIGGTSEDGQ